MDFSLWLCLGCSENLVRNAASWVNHLHYICVFYPHTCTSIFIRHLSFYFHLFFGVGLKPGGFEALQIRQWIWACFMCRRNSFIHRISRVSEWRANLCVIILWSRHSAVRTNEKNNIGRTLGTHQSTPRLNRLANAKHANRTNTHTYPYIDVYLSISGGAALPDASFPNYIKAADKILYPALLIVIPATFDIAPANSVVTN